MLLDSAKAREAIREASEKVGAACLIALAVAAAAILIAAAALVVAARASSRSSS